jgi:CheY-like chemotaxis protein
MHRLRAGIDGEGNLVSWTDRMADTTIIGQQDPKQAQAYELGGAVDSPYPAQHFRMSYVPVDSGATRGAWRGVEMRPLQVLLVDDDALVLGVLTGLLESLGHAVVSAGNAPEAELAFSVHGQVELLLSDYHLPETTGLSLAKRFTAHKPELRVILMSGGNPEQETLNEIRKRDWAFLPKPMSHSDLVKALKNSFSPCKAD